jgi:hypothetical protein
MRIATAPTPRSVQQPGRDQPGPEGMAPPREAGRIIPTALRSGFEAATLAKPPAASKAESAGGVRELPVTAQAQTGNACGTTALSSVFTYWNKPISPSRIDAAIRRLDLFTAPDELVRFARDNGMRASLKQGASLEDVARMLDQGVPPIALIEPRYNPNPNDLVLHYVTVKGYTRAPDGTIETLRIADSAGGGHEYDLSADEFLQLWSDLRMAGVATGLDRVMISVVPADGRSVVGLDGVSRRASDIRLPGNGAGATLTSMPARTVAVGLANIANGARTGDPGKMIAGRIQLLGGGLGALVSKLPVPGANLLGGAVAGTAFLAGKVVDAVGERLGDAVRSATSTAQAVGDALGSAARSVGRFVRRLF